MDVSFYVGYKAISIKNRPMKLVGDKKRTTENAYAVWV